MAIVCYVQHRTRKLFTNVHYRVRPHGGGLHMYSCTIKVLSYANTDQLHSLFISSPGIIYIPDFVSSYSIAAWEVVGLNSTHRPA